MNELKNNHELLIVKINNMSNETTNVMKRGASVRCAKTGCMGQPKKKDLFESANVEPYKSVTICRNCFCVHEYVPLEKDIVRDLLDGVDDKERTPPIIRKKKKKTSQINLDLE